MSLFTIAARVRPGCRIRQFSLIFSTPFGDGLATQIYEVDNQGIGRVSMFITPVAQNVYEAPFN